MARSNCAINLSVEIIGDRWTLLILRDMMFEDRRYFSELLVSEERIASNILADRLKRLIAEGLLTRRDDPAHKQKAIYSLTEKGIAMFPVLAQIGLWGHHNVPLADLNPRGRAMLKGGPRVWAQVMAHLRRTHLGEASSSPRTRSARGEAG